MSELRLTVLVGDGAGAFTPDHAYDVLMVQEHRFLLIDDAGRFTWLATDQIVPATVERAGERLFDIEVHKTSRRLLDLVGKPVLLTTWENIGFDPDSMTDEGMYCYRGTVESYDGETLFLNRPDDSRFGILPRVIATLDESP